MRTTRPFIILLFAAMVAVLVMGSVEAAPGPPPGRGGGGNGDGEAAVAKPHPFAWATDANQFVQVAASSTSGRTDGQRINGVDMKLEHVLTAADIKAPNSDASYSFSIGAYTTEGHWLQMGYIVLGSDGDGLARWFVQVLEPDGSTKVWKLSRAGEANPPPACSACSGGSTDGYPFAFTSTDKGEWTFWFDGINKVRVRLGPKASDIDPSPGVFFIGEVTAESNVTTNIMGPRTTLRTLSLWSNDTGSWAEAESAEAAYFSSTDGEVCAHGIEPAGIYDPAGNYEGIAHKVNAGTDVACSEGALW